MQLLVHLNCANVKPKTRKFEDGKTVELSRVHFKKINPMSPRCATYEQKSGGS